VRIEDNALIGDCQSAALVARDGSIDWLCWPRFDSPACFAALLGTPENGRWRIAPVGECKSVRRYRPGTMIVETDYETADGAVTLIDFMPVRTQNPDLVRMVVGRRGRVKLAMEFIVRFEYGSAVPWVTRLGDHRGIRAIAGPDKVLLCSPVSLRGKDLTTEATFEVGEGERLPFILTYCPSHFKDPQPIDAERALAQCEAFWRNWCERCSVHDEWSDLVARSLMTLKALTYAPTGGMVAAPTTSLPERIGGVRNWDYRYCWLRDATLTLLALMNGGYREEAIAWREWLARTIAGSPHQMQIMYGLAGERRLDERELDWLPGYEGSTPVRIGNAASGQLQLDVYGEVMDALHVGRKSGLATHEPVWAVQLALLEHLEKVWTKPDSGLWEVRGPPRHFTYSKVMCWVALDRAERIARALGKADEEAERIGTWQREAAAIREAVMRHGRRDDGAFVQYFGSDRIDASALVFPLVGFVRASAPSAVATLQAVRDTLEADGLVKRYAEDVEVEGVAGREAYFLICSYWLCDNLTLRGELDAARRLFEEISAHANDLGLFSEEWDPVNELALGNFPQAFTHIALISSAHNLERAAKGRAEGEVRGTAPSDR
jgi:GH15 family glucan-1,4-alpha-glucosidase